MKERPPKVYPRNDAFPPESKWDIVKIIFWMIDRDKDKAKAQNYIGFNTFDSRFFHCELKFYRNPDALYLMWDIGFDKMAAKLWGYREQIREMGIDEDTLYKLLTIRVPKCG